MTNDDSIHFIRPDWPAPRSVHAVVTTRGGGRSGAPYASFNLAQHTGDQPERVRANRALLREALRLPAEPTWLTQVHGARVIDITDAPAGTRADGAYANQSGVVCAVLTADCLSIFICNRTGTEIALLHAGWRGLAAGVIEAGLERFRAPRDALLAWLGPAIGANAYEVGADVRDALAARDPRASSAFAPIRSGKWYLDLYAVARQRLSAAGVRAISGGEHCTVKQSDLFFSYRRDGVTGRMASLLWLE